MICVIGFFIILGVICYMVEDGYYVDYVKRNPNLFKTGTKEKEMQYEPKVTFLQKKELKIHLVEGIQFVVDGIHLVNLTENNKGKRDELPTTTKLFRILNENGDVTYEVVE